MNIASPVSRFWSIGFWSGCVIPAVLSVSLSPAAIAQNAVAQNAVAQNTYADQLPPSPAAEVYGAPSMTYNTAPINASPMTAFRVIIPSDNPTLLAQAKAIEPTAFLQTLNGQRVIQVGLYGNESIARQQVTRFQSQGMPVMIQSAEGSSPSVPIAPQPLPALSPNHSTGFNPNTFNPNTFNPNAFNPNPLPVVQTSAKGYYVIIPTAPSDVNAVQAQLNQLGIPSQYIFLRDRPFGIHYAIGVFSQRSQADKMADLLRSRAQLDSRVHFER
jgi:hypothetical protein